MLVTLLVATASMVFVFGTPTQDTLEDRLATMNVTTITTRITRNQVVNSGQALVITGAGRVEADITVNPGGLLVVDSHGEALRGGNNAFRGRIFLRGGDFYLLGGALWHEAIGNNPTHPLVLVENGSNFTMRDGLIRSRSTTASNGTFGVNVVNGTFTMEGGLIFGSSHAQSPAVRVAPGNNGSFVMTGGVLQLCNASNSVGARVEGGTFYMYGGEVRNPGKHSRGTGVYVTGTGTFVMNGGEIYYNDTGVEVTGVNAEFVMNGGVIRDHVSTSGAGVDVIRGASFTMNGGYIANNRVTKLGRAHGGGGVRVSGSNSTFVMYGGAIQDNRAPLKKGGHGGGVTVRDSGGFYMHGGLIANNMAGSGGGVMVTGKARMDSYMVMTGGTIANNEATFGNMSHGGGGVNVYGHKNGTSTFTMYGGYIIENRTSSRGGGSGKKGVGGGGVAIGTNNIKGEAARIQAVATFNMHGGVIADNLAQCDRTKRVTDRLVGGGGVYVYRRGSFFNMTGGEIRYNSSVAGGGVGLWNAAEFNMHGGVIRNNEAYGGYFARAKRKFNLAGLEIRGGGGVYLHNKSVKSTGGHRPTFNMHGGYIVENISPEGGGIFWMSILCKVTHHRAAHLRNLAVRESTLTRVYISQYATVQNNIATNGTRVCDELWGRHRAEDPTVNWGGRVYTRTVPAPNGGTFAHLFNNHDILTWGQGTSTSPYTPYNITFVAGPQGRLNNGTAGANVVLPLYYEDTVGANRVPNVTTIHGWQFVGWSYDYYGYYPADPANHQVAGDINFYAQHERVSFRVTFEAGPNGVITGPTYIDVYFEDQLTFDMLPTTLPDEDFALSAWDPDPMHGITVTEDMTVTASFVRMRVTVRFEVDPEYGGFLGQGQPYMVMSFLVGDTIDPPAATPQWGFAFNGWSPDPTGLLVVPETHGEVFVAQFGLTHHSAPLDDDLDELDARSGDYDEGEYYDYYESDYYSYYY